MYRSHVMVCGGTGCTSSNSDKIAQAFETEIQATGLQDEVKVIPAQAASACVRWALSWLFTPKAAFTAW